METSMSIDSTQHDGAATKPRYTLLCILQDTNRFADALGLPSVKKLTWPTRGIQADNFGSRGRLPCADAQEVARYLEVAQRHDIPVWLDEPPVATSEGARFPELGTVIYTHEKWGCTLRITRMAEGDAFLQTRSRYGDVGERRLITPEATHVLSTPQIAGASPRLERYLVKRRISRLTRLHSPEQLARWLTRTNAQGWEVLLGIEELLGGLVGEYDWLDAANLRFGPWLVVQIEQELREEHREPSDPSETRWPFFHLRDHLGDTELCLVGTFRQRDHDIAVDRLGRIYFWNAETDEVRIMGATGLGMLENFALVDELRSSWNLGPWITVEADLGATFAERAGLMRAPGSSDEFIEDYLGPGCWIRRRKAVSLLPPETYIAATTAEAALQIAKLAREHAPASLMHVPTSLLKDQEQRKVLNAAGSVDIDVTY